MAEIRKKKQLEMHIQNIYEENLRIMSEEERLKKENEQT
jgi:hypothetical protein